MDGAASSGCLPSAGGAVGSTVGTPFEGGGLLAWAVAAASATATSVSALSLVRCMEWLLSALAGADHEGGDGRVRAARVVLVRAPAARDRVGAVHVHERRRGAREHAAADRHAGGAGRRRGRLGAG